MGAPLKSPYATLAIDTVRRTVRLHRTKVPFRSRDDIEQLADQVDAALAGVSRETFGLLLDVRDAPPRPDPAFASAFARLRERSAEGFAVVAVVVATSLGQHQAHRYGEQLDLPTGVFGNEADALRFVTQRLARTA